MLSGTDHAESSGYLNKCLHLVIGKLEDPLEHQDENLLATVIILRLHEEISGTFTMKKFPRLDLFAH